MNMDQNELEQLVKEIKSKMASLPSDCLENIIDRISLEQSLTASDVSNMKRNNVFLIFKQLVAKYNIRFDIMKDVDYSGGFDNNRL